MGYITSRYGQKERSIYEKYDAEKVAWVSYTNISKYPLKKSAEYINTASF